MKLVSNCRIIVLVAMLAAIMPLSASAEEAADMFDCKVCHPMKIRDFKGRRANPIVPVEEFPQEPTGKQDIASTSGMCLSCHDGFVEDSREVWKEGYRGHRLGMEPGDGMHGTELDGLPEFPLNEDGKIYCGTCHSAHLSEAEGAPKKVKLFMRASHQGGNICQACHRDKQAIADTGHNKGSRRAGDFERRGTCGTCHAAHGSDFPLMWSRSLGTGNHVVNKFCRSCHEETPEPAEHPARVVAWSQPLRQAVRGNAAAAMPVYDEHGSSARTGSITCATCHDVHRERADDRRADLPGLHLRMPEIAEPLCADCHGQEALFLYKYFHSGSSR